MLTCQLYSNKVLFRQVTQRHVIIYVGSAVLQKANSTYYTSGTILGRLKLVSYQVRIV